MSFCDICQHTSSRSLFAGHWPVSALPPAKRRARLNTCRSRPVRARCTRCRCFYVFVLVSLSHHKSIGGRLLLFPQASQDGLALCHLSRQDTSRGVPSQGGHWNKVCACVHKVAGASFDRWGYGAPTAEIRSRGQCLCSCVTLPSQDQPLVDARAGYHLRVGAAQEEEGWRRRAL